MNLHAAIYLVIITKKRMIEKSVIMATLDLVVIVNSLYVYRNPPLV